MSTAATRFADNTATIPVDRRRVYGYAPGHLYMSMNARGSNVNPRIPQGQLILFKPRVDGYQKEKMKTVVRVVNERTQATEAVKAWDGHEEYSARHWAEAVAAKFQGGKSDFGFRILDVLTPLEYDRNTGYDEADAYFAVLHPELKCEMGLEEVLYGPAGDLLNEGKPMPCPTCRLKWLESDECQQAIFGSTLDYGILDSLRKTLISSNKAAIQFARVKFGKAQAEVESGKGKQAYDDADYHFMKMIHEKPKHIQQAEITANAAKVQGVEIGKAVADAFLAKQEADREMEEFRAWRAAQDAEKQNKQDVKKTKDK